MLTDTVRINLEEQVAAWLQDDASGHDYHHAQRVQRLATTIQAEEGRGDRAVVQVAALVHDICRPWEKRTGKSHFGPEALEIIRQVLVDAGVADGLIEPVLEVVREHDLYDWAGTQTKSIELQIVQDADNLDAMGAIGIGRTFLFGGVYHSPVYYPGEEADPARTQFQEDPSREKASIIGHFYEKLLRLRDVMNTPTGKRMAQQRHHFMEQFLEQFFAEWRGER